MTCGIILIQMSEKSYTVDMLIHKKILPNVDNKLIKANFIDLVTFRININFIQMFEINIHYSKNASIDFVTKYKVHFSPKIHSDSILISPFICWHA